jgi:fluoride exporter
VASRHLVSCRAVRFGRDLRHDGDDREGVRVTAVLVFVGAAIGAPLRYLTDRFVQSRARARSPHLARFPFGTLAVNVVGSFVVGCVAGASPDLVALIGTGLCGGMTTYSTFSYETVRLTEDGRYWQALANIATSIAAGVAAAALGYTLTR